MSKSRIMIYLAAIVLTFTTILHSAWAENIEQRYVMGWNVEPIARLSMDKQIYLNGVRCRIDDGDYKDIWLSGKDSGIILGKTTWRFSVAKLTPGTYKVTYDLRTPTGAQWVPGVLRVPQIARGTGQVGKHLSAPAIWPQDKYERIACDNGPVEFAWDRDNLYIRPAAGSPGSAEISLDLLPATAGKHITDIRINGITTLPWTKLFPAIPLTGQTIRYKVTGSSSDWVDVLFVGSGLPQYYGATIVSDGPGGDDQGSSPEILSAQYDTCGLNVYESGVSWGSVEHQDPGDGESVYDWHGIMNDPNLYKGKMVYINLELGNSWADKLETTDPDRYWKLAERFACEAARKYASVGVKYFSVGINEPEMYFRSDREDFVSEQLTHFSNGIHKGNPDAVIIAGKFCSGNAANLHSYYARGFKDNFDALDIHPYNNDPKSGTDMDGITACHEFLESVGMGQKRIFLGEGWGPTRDLKQVVRTKWDAPVTKAEADYTRQFYQNGYRCLASAREDYSPDWVLAAKYFTFNDNVGGTYWRQAARPVTDDKGNLLYYMIGGLQFGKDNDFAAFFCNGGLIDFFGKPKGQWFQDFPPALPEVRILTNGGPDHVVEGEWYTVNVDIVNANPRPITGLVLGVRERMCRYTGEFAAKPVGDYKRSVLNPGEVWHTALKVSVPKADPGKVRWAFELDYKYDGEQHTSDDIVATEIRKPLTISTGKPTVLDPAAKTNQAAVTLTNNRTSAPMTCKLLSYDGADFKAVPSKSSVTLGPGESAAVTYNIELQKLTPGIRDIPIVADNTTRLSIVTPLNCTKLGSALTIDGDLADWPHDVMAKDAVCLGNTIGVGERPADDPFPEPPPAKASALETKTTAEKSKKETTVPVFGANAAVTWDDKNFYLAVGVEDEHFMQENTGIEVWRQDSIQIALDPLSNGAIMELPYGELYDGYAQDDYEIALAQTPQGPQIATSIGPRGTVHGVWTEGKLAVRHSGKFTTYEAQIPWNMIQGFTPVAGARMGLDILVNNFENEDRYMLGWADAIGAGKFPARFIPVVLQ